MPVVQARDATPDAGHEQLVQRDTPKLNGSGAAFVALVIVLAFIIIVSCSAAIYLLWESNNKADRRSRIRRYQASGLEAAASQSTFVARVGKLFGFHRVAKTRSSKHTETPKKKSIKGWIDSVERETSRDVLATIAEEQPEEPTKGPDSRQMSQTVTPSVLSTASVLDTSQRGYLQPVPLSRDRTSSILSDGSMTVSFVSSLTPHPELVGPAPRHHYSIPTIIEPVPESAPLASNLSSPSISPPPQAATAATSAEHLIYPNGKGRPFATRSGTSITFDGGTKFVEEL